MIKGLDFHRVSDQQNYCTIPGELPTKMAKTCITPENLGRGYWSLIALWCSRKCSLCPPNGGDDAESSHLTFILVKIIDPLKTLDQKSPWAVSPSWYLSHNRLLPICLHGG